MFRRPVRLLVLALMLPTWGLAVPQDRLKTMPRYDRYEKLRREIAGSVKRGSLAVQWADDAKSFTYRKDEKRYRYDVASRKATEIEAEPARPPGGRGRRNPERGRQYETVLSADEKKKAVHRDRNVFISDADGKNEIAVTTDGSAEKRTKYGVASWVYGEELGVREAMWWSPDGGKLAFYKFDESEVKDYHLAMDQLKLQTTLDAEAYPKAGTPNPKVELHVYDLASKATTKLDVNFDSSAGPDLGHYVYQVRWSPDGKELFFNRTDRKQRTMEWVAADPATGKGRVVVRESHPNSWADNSPAITFLEDGKRFLWVSERTGFRNVYLYDLSGKLLNAVTQHPFEVDRVVHVDEKRGLVTYTARSAPNPYLMQLHRVRLNGKDDQRLTDPAFSHTVSVAPDGRHFVDVAETLDVPPTTRLLDEKGKAIETLAESDLTKFTELGLKKTMRLIFKAADQDTDLHGELQFPSDFDTSQNYPVIVQVYGGPESGGGQERFQTPHPITEMGFLVASFEGRGTNGRGKAFKDAVYGKLGIVEIDDQAAGVRYLRQKPYVNGSSVGITGTSYGGYASVMALLRYPEFFHAAVASSSVTDWRNYDTIYTERYMGLPQEGENKEGYEAGSAMKFAKDLQGRLMLYYGSSDNNVHPSNTLQLAKALNEAGKSYEMMVGPTRATRG
jgi:dipeptidyl-peptidase-4